MPFKKGESGNPAGRPRGSGRSAQVLQGFYDAWQELGGIPWLVAQGKKDPKTFMQTLSKILPRQIQLEADLEIIGGAIRLDMAKDD